MNIESIMKQIEDVEFNVRRLKTVMEADLALDFMVPLYCTEKAILQLVNIKEEMQKEMMRLLQNKKQS